MRTKRMGCEGLIAGVLLGALVGTTGCEGADDASNGATESELHGGFRLHPRHHGADAGGVGGSAVGTPEGTGGVTGATTPGTGGATGVTTTGGNGGTSGPSTPEGSPSV